ncbi:MAG TPA: hypothetical protein VG167_09995 [Verrucomicrobiae bacterium]|nr:hypothetical protein [Verrucomicrobiae bacterium]
MLASLPLAGLLLAQPLLIFAFPSGLPAFFTDTETYAGKAAIMWVFYAAVVAAALLARRRGWFILFYVVLCVALAVNVTGCYRIVNETLKGLK